MRPMRVHVEAWDPRYGANADGGDSAGPEAASSEEVDPAAELPPESWQPLAPPPGLRAPDVVLLVDGVRRIDAHMWVEESDTSLQPCLAASYAAGVVRCDLRRGAAEVASARIVRGLFTPSPLLEDLTTTAAQYVVKRVGVRDPGKLANQVMPHLRALEVDVSRAQRAEATSEDDLLVVDGPLEDRGALPRAIGYVKTHRRTYLPPQLATVITRIKPGQRTPYFSVGTRWRQYSWYLRLPGPVGSPWAGIVRVECSAELSRPEVTHLADLSAVTLPRLASTSYKDPRAPQNLVPIAGLEKRLRAMLGNAQLLHRALQSAVAAGNRAAPSDTL